MFPVIGLGANFFGRVKECFLLKLSFLSDFKQVLPRPVLSVCLSGCLVMEILIKIYSLKATACTISKSKLKCREIARFKRSR